MLRQVFKAMAVPAQLVWRFTGKPVYQRLFGRYFQAIISRLNSTLGQLNSVRMELDDARREIVECRARQEELERHMRTVTANHWDTTALTRRLAAIEDRIAPPEQPTGQSSSNQDNNGQPSDLTPGPQEQLRQ